MALQVFRLMRAICLVLVVCWMLTFHTIRLRCSAFCFNSSFEDFFNSVKLFIMEISGGGVEWSLIGCLVISSGASGFHPKYRVRQSFGFLLLSRQFESHSMFLISTSYDDGGGGDLKKRPQKKNGLSEAAATLFHENASQKKLRAFFIPSAAHNNFTALRLVWLSL